MTRNNHKHKTYDKFQAAAFVAGGAAAGARVATVVGGMGLTVGGGGIAIGMAPIAAAGAVVGLAGYGLSKLFGSNPKQIRSRNRRNR
jgi:hypothetical protein